MGKTPLIGLAGLCLAGAALCGCQDNKHAWNGQRTSPSSPTAMTPSGTSGGATAGAWNTTPNRNLASRPMGSPDFSSRTGSGMNPAGGMPDSTAGLRQASGAMPGTPVSGTNDPAGSGSFDRTTAMPAGNLRGLDDPGVHNVSPPSRTPATSDITAPLPPVPPPPPSTSGMPMRTTGLGPMGGSPMPPPVPARPTGAAGMNAGGDPSLTPPPPMTGAPPQTDARYQTDSLPPPAPPSVPTMPGKSYEP